MKYLLVRVIVAIGLAAISGVPTSAQLYPAYPPSPGSRPMFAILQPSDFVQSVAQATPFVTNPDELIGDHLGEHPGAFVSGMPPDGSFLVGVFGGPIAADRPNAIGLWETSGPRPIDFIFGGPGIQLGFWDGFNFIPFGDQVQASYRDTGAPADDAGMHIASSVIPLSRFNLMLPPFVDLNAIRIEAIPGGHNQVTGAAINVTNFIPEPSAVVLFGTGLVCVLARAWKVKKQ
jgi:hypothetical protein